ncbi:hypothetical protein IJD44_03545 [bacterium]|nr:hypothetical protein [bacterium]
MRVSGINSTMPVLACQPIKPVLREQSFKSAKAADNCCKDTFESQNTSILEQKYDLACRIAAYYKTQYEQLLKNGGVVV